MRRLLIVVATVAVLSTGCSATVNTAKPVATPSASPSKADTPSATPSKATVTKTVTVTQAPVVETPKPKPTPKPSPTVSPEVRAVLYLQLIRKHYPVLTGVNDKTLLTFAHQACSTLASGTSFTTLIGLAIKSNVPAGEAGYMIGSGVAAFCPDQSSKVHS